METESFLSMMWTRNWGSFALSSGADFTHVPYASGLSACIPASAIREFLKER